MKFVIFGDTHVGFQKSSDLYHNVTYTFFDDVVKFCLQHDIKQVVHLGDFFHDRKELNTKSQNVAHRIADLFEKNKIIMFLITGNHDVYYKDSLVPSTLELFRKYEYITVIDNVTNYGKDIVFSPWGIIPQPSQTKAKYCFGHFEIIGFKMNNSYACEKGQSIDDFKHFKHVWSGHFHIPSNNGNITCLGSPYPMTFHDVNSVRGFYVWDDGKTEFHAFDKAPKFIIMETDKIDRTLIKGNIIKLVFNEDYGNLQNQKLIDEVQSFNPIRFQTDFSHIKIEGTEDKRDESEEKIGLLNHKEIINEYVKKSSFPEHIKPSVLLSMIEKLKEE